MNQQHATASSCRDLNLPKVAVLEGRFMDRSLSVILFTLGDLRSFYH
jgi:hypothetical protein